MRKTQLHAFSIALILMLVVSFLPTGAQPAYAVSADVVISQVYGGGGNSGAIFTNDFVELFNRGTSTVSVAGWSIQYASATGTGNFGANSGQLTPLSGSVQPGQYLLIQEASNAAVGAPLPTPDVIDLTPIAMAAGAGKVALVNTSTPLGCNGGSTPCSPAALAQIVDLVGYGTGTSGANFFEGTGPAPTISATLADFRRNSGAQDTDNNSADFIVGAPNPRNSTFPFGGIGTANPNGGLPGDVTLLTVTATPGLNPPSTGIGVSCDLTAIGGSASQAFYDDGTHGDATAGNLTFSYQATVASTATGGAKSLACTVADAQGRSAAANISYTVTLAVPIGTVNGPVLDTDNGATHVSPNVGQIVTVKGVIYEKTLQAISNSSNTYKGFFIQNTAATADGNSNTSDGLFVFMNTNTTLNGPSGPYTPTVGDEVVISGSITEFFNMTEMQAPNLSVIQVTRSGVDIDADVAPIVADPPVSSADANRYWERLQGMRVQVPQNSIVLGGRNVFSPADAEIWLARSDYSAIMDRTNEYARRAFRDAHPLDDNYDPANWDGNGYRILMGSLGIKAAAGDAQALIDPARSFDTVTNSPSGGINYSFSKYRIEVSQQPEFNEGPDPSQNNPPQAFDRNTEYSIADYNVENLYDYRDNPFSGCDFNGGANTMCDNTGTPFISPVKPAYDYVPVSDAAYQARLTDIARQIINDLHSPDILMVQEVENQDICTVTGGALTCGTTDNADGKPDDLQELALRIASLGGPAYDAAFDRDSSDLRGIAPSFLYRTDRVELRPAAGDPVLDGAPAIGTYGSVPYDSDTSNPKTLNAPYTGTGACETNYVFPRAPDIGLFRIYQASVGVGPYRDVYAINNHFKSGPDTCVAHRTEQAKYNAALVAFIQAANPDARIVLGGDLNVYPRPDDPFAPIGQPGSSDQLGSLYDPALSLKNLWETELADVPASAYSYVFVGQAQTIDQTFINAPMLTDLSQYRTAHINSDWPADYPGDVARGTSDHDPSVARFFFSLPPVVAAPTVSVEPSTEGSSVSASAAFTDPEGDSVAPFTCTVNYGDGSGDLAGTVAGSTCSGPAHAYATYGTYTVTVTVIDKFGSSGSNSTVHTVIFNWTGFLQPVDNLPTLNVAKAGSAIPVKFQLGGDKGLAIFATDYPKSVVVACESTDPVDAIESTVTAGSSSLQYDPLTDTYTYVWKTDKAWAGTCRQLIVKLVDGTIQRADFKLTK